MESLLRSLAIDLGPASVRVVGIRSGGMVDTRTIQQAFANVAHTQGIEPSHDLPWEKGGFDGRVKSDDLIYGSNGFDW